MSPNFTDTAILGSRVVLICLLGVVAILARGRQRWSAVLPVLMLIAAALLGQRNLPFLGAGVAPFLAAALMRVYTPSEPDTPRLILIGSSTFLVFGIFFAAVTYGKNPYNLKPYPVAAVNWLQQNHEIGGSHRIAAPDYVGCYMIYKYGTNANVFIDDRYDMYPLQISQDSRSMLGLPTDLGLILERYDFDSVLYQRNTAVAQFLSIDPNWRQVWSDKNWIIFQPVPAASNVVD
jgi:hypothetical protein